MLRTVSKKMVVVGLVIFGWSLCAADASAGCRHRYACYSGCSWGYGSCCGWSACWTPMSCCGIYVGAPFTYWGSPAVSGCGCSGVILDSAPVPAVDGPTLAPPRTPPLPTPPKPAVPNHSSIERTRSGLGILTVRVPYDAKVTINGAPTKSLGSVRQYSCDGLLPGSTYKFEVKAKVVREGKIVTETQTVSLTAGDRGRVAFSFDVRGTEGLAAAK